MPLSAIVFGAYGLVGSCLMDELQKQKVTVCGVDKIVQASLLHIDLCDFSRVNELLRCECPKVVFIPAAITNVDYCEKNPVETYKTNVLALCNLIRTSCSIGAKIVFFSTDYIFDGTAGPYSESYPTNPICKYGHQKLIVEHYILSQTDDYLIIRTTAVFGWEKAGKNFAVRLINSLRLNHPIKVPKDQVTTPTYAPVLALMTSKLAMDGQRGIFNVAGSSLLSRYEFATDIAHTFQLDASLISPVKTEVLGQIANRPLSGGLKTEKVSQTLKSIQIPDHIHGLQTMFKANEEHRLVLR